MPATALTVAADDPLLWDAESLLALVGEAVYADGLADFKAQRVVEIDSIDGGLIGCVEDEVSGDKLSLQISADPNLAGGLQVDCGCGAAQCCRHAVALLCRYAAEAVAGEAGSARAAALEERRQKARSEVKVEPPRRGGWFGRWNARSFGAVSHFGGRYQVDLYVLEGVGNCCSCPDFAVNRLGTCKHIEAVLHALHKRPGFAAKRRQSPERSVLYLQWSEDGGARLRLRRGSRLDAATAAELAPWLDAGDGFRGRLPEDFQAFCERFGEREDLIIGEDARRHVARLSQRAAQRQRAATIGHTIRSSGGVLQGLRARLYPYQIEGIAFLAANGRAMLADDMGLGKTLQAIAAAFWMQQQEGVGRVLVVCPTSLKHQWAREIERFTGQRCQIVSGGVDERAVQYRREADFHIVNYELLLRDLEVIGRELRPDLLILDEAQRIKNWRSKTAAAVKRIDTRYAFVLSGTPLENRLEDLYSLMQVVDDQVLGPLWRYQIDFHVSDERGKVIGYRNLSELRRRIAPVMLRRSRSLVADQLPDRVEKLLEVPMTDGQKQAHDSALLNASRLAVIARRRPLTPVEQNQLMASLQSARMACNALGLLDGETEGSPKLDELSNLLEQHCLEGGQKMVVFSQWERMTRMAEHCALGLGLGVLRLHGGVPGDKRGELIRRFHDDDSAQVFIATDAGATGLNLQVATVLVNLDIPWNPAVLDQRIARIHRLGQKRSVFVVNMLAFEGYEARVLQLVQGKRSLFDNVVDPEAQADVVGLSRQALDSVLGSLAPAADGGSPAEAAADPPSPASSTALPADEARAVAPDDNAPDPSVAAAIVALQQRLGTRLEQLLATAGGLLAIVHEYRDGDEAMAADIATQIQTADQDGEARPLALSVLDRRGWQALQRLGQNSPLASLPALYQAAASEPGPPALWRQAEEKLAAAEQLARLGQRRAAAELLASVLRACAALRGGLAQPPVGAAMAVWLYSEAVPRGWLSGEEAAAVLRADALLQAEEVPEPLLQQLIVDAGQSLARAYAGGKPKVNQAPCPDYS